MSEDQAKYEDILDEIIEENEDIFSRLTTLENQMKALLGLYRDVVVDNSKLEKRVRKLEQPKNNKHRVLLNNCVDDDEAILHKREIEEASQ